MAKAFQGKVVSTKMNKTVVVEVVTVRRHPLYKKIVQRFKRYKAHNEDLPIKEGDNVEIGEIRPLSKDKHFKVVRKLES